MDKIKISTKKIVAFFVSIVLIIIQLIVFSSNVTFKDDIVKTIRIDAFICVINFIICIYLWKYIRNELLTPYTVFFIVLFLFTCGQSIGWILNINMGTTDLMYRIDNGMNKNLVLSGLKYSSLAISFFNFGALIVTKNSIELKSYKTYEKEDVIGAINSCIKYVMIIVVPCYIFITIRNIISVNLLGYVGIYIKEKSVIIRYMGYLSDWMLPCLLLLLIAQKDNKIKRSVILGFMAIVLLISVYYGGRSEFAMGVLALLLVYHIFIKKVNFKSLLMVLIGGYFILVLFVSIYQLRENVNRSFFDYFTVYYNNMSSAVGLMVGELGWNLSSVCWTQMLVPEKYNYRYGITYLVALLVFIPNFMFGGASNNPVNIYGNLATWLTNVLGKSYGTGYTIVAESFINFGYYGYIAMFFEGMIIAQILAKVPNKDSEKDLYHSIIQILMIMVIMKHLIRSSTSVAFHYVYYVLLPIIILIKYNIIKIKNRRNLKNEKSDRISRNNC